MTFQERMKNLLEKDTYIIKEVPLSKLHNDSTEGAELVYTIRAGNKSTAIELLEETFPHLEICVEEEDYQDNNSTWLNKECDDLAVSVKLTKLTYKGYDHTNRVVYIFCEDMFMDVEVY